MRLPTRILLFISMMLSPLMPQAAESVVTMAYRTTEKQPFIAKAPDNSGLFEDMYQEAARRAGLTLRIVRMPKVRVINALKEGEVDFYPQFTFSAKRSAYSFFAPNGLRVAYYAISTPEIERLASVADFDGLTLLHGLGNPDYLTKLGFGAARVTHLEVAEMDLQKAIHMLQKRRADAYIYEAEPLAYALLQSGASDIRLHKELSDQVEWATLGISRRSALLALEPNPDFNPNAPISRSNQAERLVPGSPMARMVAALDSMKQDGTLAALSERYLGH
ncbi:transporter substrate-binding domain-containing protein [Shewanella khirikhana]|uniref:substrate-binding periplasmic protein n=1 Tax=Shewanella khirikhana TaxID=1965282 RepID=UPI0030CD1D58